MASTELGIFLLASFLVGIFGIVLPPDATILPVINGIHGTVQAKASSWAISKSDSGGY